MSMELENTFTVPVSPEVAWDVLLDVARIAPCMPGATVDEVDGDVVTGRIKIKVGPVALTYRGTATFKDRDEAAHTVLVDASGKETRGAGTAAATIKASLQPAEGGATLVNMHTTMNVTGRPAQFGRGVMVEVGGKLVDKFAENLAVLLAADSPAADAAGSAPGGGAEAAGGGAAAGGVAGAGAADAAAGGGTTLAEANGTAVGSDAAVSSGAAAGDTGTAAGGAAPGASATAATAATATATPVAAVTATPAAAPPREDSINLVRLVGPAILKRIVPIAAIAAAVALLGSRIRRGLRRSAKD